MKTISSIHNSCLYPHHLLTSINPHAHENTYSRAGVEGYSIFRIFASEGHNYPLPPVRAYHRGHTPYLLDFQPFFCVLHFSRALPYYRDYVCVFGLEECIFCAIIAAVPMT